NTRFRKRQLRRLKSTTGKDSVFGSGRLPLPKILRPFKAPALHLILHFSGGASALFLPAQAVHLLNFYGGWNMPR
ncbi:MAG: hypothetical protein KIG49_06760, partial [Eubacteriales bacterium]|nr:hypothetical protein [Eubacteriales bacterium]